MNDPNVSRHHRRSIRIPEHDYTQPGAYFVTICTWQRQGILGEIKEGQMRLSEWGQVAAECWAAIPVHFARVVLDEWVIMPNHMHGILIITDSTNPPDVGARQCRAPTSQCRAPTTTPAPPAVEQFGHPVPGSIPTIIRSFKSIVTRRINSMRVVTTPPIWQRNYYEHIVRNDRALSAIRRYIIANPLRWALDRDNAARGLPEASTAEDYWHEAKADDA